MKKEVTMVQKQKHDETAKNIIKQKAEVLSSLVIHYHKC